VPVTDFQPLPPRALTLIRLRLLVPTAFVVLLLIAAAVVAFLAEVDPGEPLIDDPVIFGVVFAVLALVVLGMWWVLSAMVFRAYGWLLTDGTVELRHGVIVQRHQVLPRARVQNVTKEAGPVSRAFGLASITIHSAGANTPNITVPDLTVDVGDRLRSSLLPASR
jgi:membrane protein YdbS with pleckstrin-like domain